MTKESFEVALKKRSELQERIQRLNEETERIRREVADLRHELGYVEGFIAATYQQMSEAARRTEKTRIESAPLPVINPDRQEVVTAALGEIKRAGRPLSRSELFARLAEQGIEIKGKDPLMVLSTMLWRTKDRIIRHPGIGYWPSGERLPIELELDGLLDKPEDD